MTVYILCVVFLVLDFPKFSKSTQKQPPRGITRKMNSENIQQIYRRTPMPKSTSGWLVLSAQRLSFHPGVFFLLWRISLITFIVKLSRVLRVIWFSNVYMVISSFEFCVIMCQQMVVKLCALKFYQNINCSAPTLKLEKLNKFVYKIKILVYFIWTK